MAILWCGGEDIDFPINMSTLYNRGDSRDFRSGYARFALARGGAQTAYSLPFVGGAVTDCWFSFREYCFNGMGGINADNLFVGLGRSGSGCGIYVGGWHTVGSNFALYKWSDSTGLTFLQEETGLHLCDALRKVDVHISSFGATGNVEVYINGDSVSIIDYTGDLRMTGMNDLDRVCFRATSGSFEPFGISEIIVADQDTRNMSLVTLAPSAAGDLNQWTGAYTDINETAANDTTLLSVATNAQDAQFNLNDIPSGPFQVLVLKMAARAMKGASSPVGTLKLGVKSGGNVDVDAGQAVAEVWTTYERLAATINGAALTPALLNALQVNYRSAA